MSDSSSFLSLDSNNDRDSDHVKYKTRREAYASYSSDGPTCGICYEGESEGDNPFLEACDCTSFKQIHKNCYEKYYNFAKLNKRCIDRCGRCEDCKSYKFCSVCKKKLKIQLDIKVLSEEQPMELTPETIEQITGVPMTAQELEAQVRQLNRIAANQYRRTDRNLRNIQNRENNNNDNNDDRECTCVIL